MNIKMIDGLPTVEVKIKYNNKEKMLRNVLIDTGSSNTILDVDSVQDIGLVIDPLKGKARRMYGVGGESELCYEQNVENLTVGEYLLNNFTLQLGMTKENYGFECILGVDFMVENKVILDFERLSIK
ncbi:aspartyl protease family protein [Dethiothermospora halolimnae]|uniref:aspartyl protease family protein n=1 Tax=Dethiothermospora halolimnae TaxID=3114390 RepID=UPI003CCC400A